MCFKPGEKPARRDSITRYLEPGVDIGTDKPCPDGALVIREVSGAKIAEVLGLIVEMIRSQRSQAHGGQQARFHLRDDTQPTARVEHGISKGERQNLIGPEGVVVSVLSVDYVVEILPFLVPEAVIERRVCARSRRRVG